MDRFDLKWPKTDATFFTDGWRCRIVWRQKGGIGGTIDNNVQCVQRVAQSLEGAPYLLNALKARGHDRLANQIQSAVEPALDEQPTDHRPAQPMAVRTVRKPLPVTARQPAPESASRKPAAADIVASWVDSLDGAAGYESAANRRAKTWLELGELPQGGDALLLKTPAPKGKQEWVLKCTAASQKPTYVAASSFKGIAGYLLKAAADAAFIEHLFDACAEVSHVELASAARSWRAAAHGATH